MLKRYSKSKFQDKEKIKPALNQQSSQEKTILHIAARNNDVDLVEILLGYGADPFLKNLEDETPEQLAEKLGFMDVKKNSTLYN